MTELEYRKQRYETRKREHRCVACGQEDALTMMGKARCAKCAEIASRASERYRQSHSGEVEEQRKLLSEQRIENRLCLRCGSPVEAGHKYCPDCLRSERLRSKRRWNRGYRAPKIRPDGPATYDGIPRSQWPDYGFCYQCGDPLDWERRVCRKCYAVMCANLARAREKQKQDGYSDNRWITANRNFWKNQRAAQNVKGGEPDRGT